MQDHYQLPDAEFARQFEHCSLNPALFTHEAHLRLAWILISRSGLQQACADLCTQIQRFDRTFGDGSKFNKTVTIAAAHAVHHFMAKGKPGGFQDLLEEFPRLKYNFRDLLNTHYSFDIFKDPKAKHEYLEADLLPF